MEFQFQEIFDRIKDSTGLASQVAFAKSLDMTQGAVSGAKQRGLFPVEWAVRIAHKYNLSTDWILTGEGSMKRDEAATTSNVDGQSDSIVDEFAFVYMAKAELSAGGGLVVMSEGFTNRYAFRKRWLKQVGVDEKKAVLMMVRGDSMEPTLADGDTVMVDTQRVKMVSGRVYAINCGDDMLQVKRLERRGNKVRVISDQKEIYDPYDVDPEDIRIIGQLVWYARQMVGFENNGFHQ